MTTADSTAIAYVPVPSELLPQALVAIAKVISPEVVEQELDQEIPPEHPDYGTVHEQMGPNGEGWTVEHLGRFADTPTHTTRLIGELLDQLSNNPGKYMPTSELTPALGVTQPRLRGALGGLTRHLKKHYSGLGWPMDAAWGADLGDGHALETYYRVNQEVAGNWRQVRAGQSQ